MLALLSMKPITDSVPLTLACHPQTPSQAIRGIDVVVGGTASSGLSLAFVLAGEGLGYRGASERGSTEAGCGDQSAISSTVPSVAAGAVRGFGRCGGHAVVLGVATSSGQTRLPSYRRFRVATGAALNA